MKANRRTAAREMKIITLGLEIMVLLLYKRIHASLPAYLQYKKQQTKWQNLSKCKSDRENVFSQSLDGKKENSVRMLIAFFKFWMRTAIPNYFVEARFKQQLFVISNWQSTLMMVFIKPVIHLP